MYFQTSGVELSPVVPLGAAFAVSFLTSMVGVSGAFLLVPFQVSVLGITSISVSATNLLFNVISTPGGILRFAREGRLDGRLSGLIAAGTLPGLFVGWWIRTHWLASISSFRLFVGGVMLLLAARMLLAKRSGRQPEGLVEGTRRAGVVIPLAVVVGVIGGVYGIGGGALMSPVLVAVLGLSIHAVAGATLLATFATSVVGVGIYSLLQAPSGAASPPDWPLGLLFGVGGLIGTYAGAAMQGRMPEELLRLGLALIVAGLAFAYLVPALLA